MFKFLQRKKTTTLSSTYRCDEPTLSVNGYLDILNKNNYKKNKDKWKIWFPNGYNIIDNQLNDLKISDKKQIIFAIPNCDNIVSKYNVWKTLENFYGRKKASTIIPESFLLDKDDDLEKIKTIKNQKFILKKKKQRKEGLKITSEVNKIKKSKNEDKDFLIAQKMIKPFLVNKRKINLRIYIMLTLLNGKLSVYFNEFGTCIYTKNIYDESSDDFSCNITSYRLDLNIYKENPLTFEQLKTYLKDNDIDHNLLFDKIKNKILLFIKATKSQLGDKKYKNNLCAQVFGLDFIIDKNMEPYLLECNKGPEMKPKSTLKEYPEINDEILNKIDLLKDVLNNGVPDYDKLKQIKKSFSDIYNGYPKEMENDEILDNFENFIKNEIPLNSYPKGYITGNGIKAQKDALNIIKLIDQNHKNGFVKIK